MTKNKKGSRKNEQVEKQQTGSRVAFDPLVQEADREGTFKPGSQSKSSGRSNSSRDGG